MATLWINNQFLDDESPGARVSAKDAGLLHGVGVFTTMRAAGGRVWRLMQHLARVRLSAEALGIPVEYSDEQLEHAIARLLEVNALPDARVRLTLTRGQPSPAGEMVSLRPTAFATAAAATSYPPELYQRGITVVLVDDQKLNPYDLTAGHKTLNYVSRLAALRDATARGASEALWFSVHNYLQSGCVTNVFIVERGVLVTPPTSHDLSDPAVAEACPYPKSAVLPGIVRGAVVDMARQSGVRVETQAIDINRLLSADECFITNSMMGVMPVCRIERHALGADRPGPLTLQMMELYAADLTR